MNLVWKLLRQHISVPQLAGFFFANLFGMFIVLLGYQFYHDVMPVFTADDSFMKSDFIIVNKKIGATNAFSGRTNTFSDAEFEDLASQTFIKNIGKFTGAEFKANAQMGVNGINVLNSEISFESVPDAFVDADLNEWHFSKTSKVIPIILPRSYITMYNFGFAQSHSLPKISDGLVGMIDFDIFIHGHEHEDRFKGKVIGFSNRLNSILVPQSFMDWANDYFSPGEKSNPSRLIMEVVNPANENIAKYIDKKGYEVEDDKMNAEKTTYFLRLIVSMVMVVGLVISILSFYILMLSIYLLVQKNTEKLENLLLIGYKPSRVAQPYQLLTVGLNLLVLLIAIVLLCMVRAYYMGVLETLFPDLDDGSMLPSFLAGIALLVIVTIINLFAIRQKIMRIWMHKD
ncbi:MAG: ABC transporter permease [Prevotella sp.]|nr:ABC transporter permease [Prevotella sp.]